MSTGSPRFPGQAADLISPVQTASRALNRTLRDVEAVESHCVLGLQSMT